MPDPEKPTVLATLPGKPWSYVIMLNPHVASGIVQFLINHDDGQVWENNTGANFVQRPRRP